MRATNSKPYGPSRLKFSGIAAFNFDACKGAASVGIPLTAAAKRVG
eukprot:CAMPEP_0115194268 /NCGR_PEP_ID=MMETSP0270-20121206/13984_1 /TAXON_ID=71861 /ORGANISM="Scrippsiella trochoidea, Strain CCMP3099" /LENGTH=45 /DNA_ID= /DNA_START= /DNA_END= /DNA_ORIENTATION=